MSKQPSKLFGSELIPTLNNNGYMIEQLDEYSLEFCTLYKEGENPVLEIGASYGVATLMALRMKKEVYCNDLDERHLDIIKSKCPSEQLHKLHLITGRFPDSVKFKKDFFSSILISRVLHFLDGITIVKALKYLYEILEIGGKLYVVCETPYMKNWEKFIPEYEYRLKRKEKWPGLIMNPRKYESGKHLPLLPNVCHWLDKPVLIKLLMQNGFSIEKSSYLDRKNVFPDDVLYDGRESVGCVAIKI